MKLVKRTVTSSISVFLSKSIDFLIVKTAGVNIPLPIVFLLEAVTSTLTLINAVSSPFETVLAGVFFLTEIFLFGSCFAVSFAAFAAALLELFLASRCAFIRFYSGLPGIGIIFMLAKKVAGAVVAGRVRVLGRILTRISSN